MKLVAMLLMALPTAFRFNLLPFHQARHRADNRLFVAMGIRQTKHGILSVRPFIHDSFDRPANMMQGDRHIVVAVVLFFAEQRQFIIQLVVIVKRHRSSACQ